ncbi:MAG: hypothetical protein ACLGI3_04945 [Actinomycetes bacterium]
MSENDALPDRVQAAGPAEAGWEPPDWTDVFRRHRRRQLATMAAFVLLVSVTPVQWWTGIDRSVDWSYWAVLVTMLILVGEAIHSRVSAAGRATWEHDTRRKVRVEHALRYHVSIGTADRPLVTERAQAIRTMSNLALVGWPLLAVVVAAPILDLAKIPDFLVVPVVVTCLLLLARSVRRGRWARRWLADPLPREPAAR